MALSLIPGSSIEDKKKFSFAKLKTEKIFRLLTATILFLIVIFILLNAYKAILSSSIVNLEAEIAEINKSRDTAFESEIKKKAEIIRKVRPLLDSHIKTSKVFDLLEENILNEIIFSDFNFDASSSVLTLGGVAANSYYLILQDSIFRRSPVVENLEISGLTLLENGEVAFKYAITLKPDVLFSEW